MRRALDARVTWGAGRDVFFLTFMKARGFLAQNVTQEMVSFEGPLVNTDSEYSQYNTKVIVHGELKSNITGSVNFYYNRLDLAKLMWETHDGFGFPDVPGELYTSNFDEVWRDYTNYPQDYYSGERELLAYLADRMQLLRMDKRKKVLKVRYFISPSNPYFINSRGQQEIDMFIHLTEYQNKQAGNYAGIWPTDKLEV